MIASLRKLYRRLVHAPALDRSIYAALDVATNLFARARCFSFPKNYIRRWKLDMLFGKYEPETAALFRAAVKPGMTVIDIGAHIGYYTRTFSELVGPRGKVVAFEADPENFALLQKNTRGRANVRLYNLAVTERAGTVDFYHYDDKSGAHSTLDNVPLHFAKRKMTVPSVALDAWLQERDIERIDLIKMDIEGGESAALRGMRETLKKTRALVTEFAPAWVEAAGNTPQDFLETIERACFDLFAITAQGLAPVHSSDDESIRVLLPQTKGASHASGFVNLYCVRRQEVPPNDA